MNTALTIIGMLVVGFAIVAVVLRVRSRVRAIRSTVHEVRSALAGYGAAAARGETFEMRNDEPDSPDAWRKELGQPDDVESRDD